MRKWTKSLSMLLACYMILSFCTICAFAAGPIEPDKEASLDIYYNYEGKAIAGAALKIYYMAEVDAYTEFTLTPEFAEYPISLSMETVDAWNELAVTLKGYVQKDKLTAEYTGKTDADGKFSVDSMKTGLYLVIIEKRTVGDYTYEAKPAIVLLPSADPVNNSWKYDVTVSPKVSRIRVSIPDDETVIRKVLKSWNDEGNEDKRPESIEVDLLRDGVVYDTVTLNESNNWRHTWKTLPRTDNYGEAYEWLIVEEKVEGYTVKVEQSGVTFVVTNTFEPEPSTPSTPSTPPTPSTSPEPTPPPETPPEPTPPATPELPPVEESPALPQTGLLWWPVPMLGCLGLAFIIVGIVRRRSYEE